MPIIAKNAISLVEAELDVGEYQLDDTEPSLAADESELDEDDDDVSHLQSGVEGNDDTTAFFGPSLRETPITEEDTMLVTKKMIREGNVAHPALGKILRLEVLDRTLLEDELRAWLKRTYPACSEEAKHVAKTSISRLRELIDEACTSISLENGSLRKQIPGTTSFADCLLETYPEGLDNTIRGDEMLLAIGLDKNPKLCYCFKQMSSSSQLSSTLNAYDVRSASSTIGSQTYSGVYLLDFGDKKLYVGVSDDMLYRLKAHEEDEINVMVGEEKRKLSSQGKKLHMRVVLGWPRGRCPKLASLAWETYMICALQTYKGKNQMQIHPVGGLAGPGIAIKHFRPAYLRYVQAARAAATTHDLPPIRCFKLMNPYPDELETSLNYYTGMFKDLIEDSGIDPMRFIQIIDVDSRDAKRRLLPTTISSPQARGFEFGKKYEWEPGMKGMDRRALALTKEYGVAKPARTLRATTLPPLPPDHLEAMIAKYRKKAELLKMVYPPPESEDAKEYE
ncbi:hypothetical protein L486_02267 [Kwoniella mangroviensis CBS 10435]|uniref:Uncharacterized protein n=1 Tax=Kwoniella mangroviensis CBS 10435 TaxID=1331196 RepID=A0A1B9IVQ3_9TREE|nr:hypothetical protein L486_02267 [Kwoniella mangroviensis CBS 10435]